MAKTVRLNVSVAEPVAEKLDSLCEDEGYSKADILRKSILLYEAVTAAEKQGGQLIMLSEEDGIRKETRFISL